MKSLTLAGYPLPPTRGLWQEESKSRSGAEHPRNLSPLSVRLLPTLPYELGMLSAWNHHLVIWPILSCIANYLGHMYVSYLPRGNETHCFPNILSASWTKELCKQQEFNIQWNENEIVPILSYLGMWNRCICSWSRHRQLAPNGLLQWFSNFGPQSRITSSSMIVAQTYQVGSSNLSFIKPSWWFWFILKFKNHR